VTNSSKLTTMYNRLKLFQGITLQKKLVFLSFLLTLHSYQIFCQCSATNIALNKPTTVSTFIPNAEGWQAVDGSTTFGSRWRTADANPDAQGNTVQWMYVDLGAVYNLCKIGLNWENMGFASSYKLQVSGDATNWTDVYSITGNTNYIQDIPVSGSGRYVRLYQIKPYYDWNLNYALQEFQVYSGTVNQAPTVSIGSPSNNSIFSAGSSITLAATASDADGSISKVEFYQGTVKLGEDATAPYTFEWTNVSAGTYSITAKAIDNGAPAASSTSPAISITVSAASSDLSWLLAGNTATDNSFLGTNNSKPVIFKANNQQLLTLQSLNNVNTADLKAKLTLTGDFQQTTGIATFANSVILDKDEFQVSRIFSSGELVYQSNSATNQHRFRNAIGSSFTGNLVTIDPGPYDNLGNNQLSLNVFGRNYAPGLSVNMLGNVGIGMNNPSTRLEVNGVTSLHGNLLLDGSGGGTVISVVRPTDRATMNVMSVPDWTTVEIGGGNQNNIDIRGHQTLIARFTNSFQGAGGSGALGIGTGSPTAQLHTTGGVRFQGLTPNNTFSRIVAVDADGNLAYRDLSTIIGSGSSNGIETDPVFQAEQANLVRTTGSYTNPSWLVSIPYSKITGVPAATTGWSVGGNYGTTPGTNFIGTLDNQRLVFKTANTEVATMLPDGFVGIGTTVRPEAGVLLGVNGAIFAEKLKVVADVTTWPDYVFKKNYKLRSLSEVESYIQKNNHLPDFPAASEVGKAGVDVGATQELLLKKIEELTLYIIEINKKVETLATENKSLREQVLQQK
jgi:hypothetical protein